MAHHIFQSSSELQNISEAAPSSPSFSFSGLFIEANIPTGSKGQTKAGCLIYPQRKNGWRFSPLAPYQKEQ